MSSIPGRAFQQQSRKQQNQSNNKASESPLANTTVHAERLITASRARRPLPKRAQGIPSHLLAFLTAALSKPSPDSVPFRSSGSQGVESRESSRAAKTVEDGLQKPAEPQKTRMWHALKISRTYIMSQTLHFDTLATLGYDGGMLNPTLLRKGLEIPSAEYHAYAAIQYLLTERSAGWFSLNARHTERHVISGLVELGAALMDRVSGPHFTFVDPNLHDRAAMVAQALRLVELFRSKHIRRRHIVVSIPATEKGIRAARQLETEYSIRTNLVLVSSFAHAVVCAEAGASSLTFSYNHVSRAHLMLGDNAKRRPDEQQTFAARRVIEEIQMTAAFLKLHKLRTQLVVDYIPIEHHQVMQSFRGVDCVAIGHRLSDRTRASTLSLFPELPEDAQVKQRATAEQYPTSYLSGEEGFLMAMSAEMRSLARVTLTTGLDAMQRDMHEVRQVVFKALQFELHISALDEWELAALYVEDLPGYGEDETQGAKAAEVARAREARRDHVGYRVLWMDWEPLRRTDDGLSAIDTAESGLPTPQAHGRTIRSDGDCIDSESAITGTPVGNDTVPCPSEFSDSPVSEVRQGLSNDGEPEQCRAVDDVF
ncbi:hypothetical protein B0H21DRAFT_806731 [Amylocystis lapponica]|nr:hypothetical protein B0H21DRAFT_806731 [Amylocystis lapponica]